MDELREELKTLVADSRKAGRDAALLTAIAACKAMRDEYAEMRKSGLLTQAGKDLYASSWAGADRCVRALCELQWGEDS